MSRYKGKKVTELSAKPLTGVLLTNLGTPEQPTPKALRKYLGEFLSDPRVVEIPRLLWLIILHGIILRVRPAKSAKLYQNIWTEQGSPLLVISKQQQQKIAQRLSEQYGDNVQVALAMRYGEPSIKKALAQFRQANVTNIVVLPLYPQYSGPTTGSTFDAVVGEIKQWRWIPNFHFISGYHQHPHYIKALAQSVKTYIEQHGKPEKLVVSYHGMPKAFQDWGDPYALFCQQTTTSLQKALNLSDNDLVMSYQSRFGNAEWLKPYTEDVLVDLAQQGIKNIAIMCPAFSSDCLETIDEIQREYREIFIDAGGETFQYIAALNDNEEHIDALVDIICPYLNPDA
jgi:ferrochelatase